MINNKMLKYDDNKIYDSNVIDETAKSFLDNDNNLNCLFFVDNNNYNIAGSRMKLNVCEFDNFKPDNEKVICRCMYKLNKEGNKCSKCDKQVMKKYIIKGDYNICEYEVPVKERSKRAVDLIIKGKDNKIYFTEFKPKNNNETLLRMCFEIITYTNVLKYRINNGSNTLREYFSKEPYNINCDSFDNEINLAIMFVKGSDQEKDFYDENTEKYTKEIIKKFNISVFRLEECNDNFVINKIQ